MQIDINVEREVLNHKTLVHPNIVQFREVSCRSQAHPRSCKHSEGLQCPEQLRTRGRLLCKDQCLVVIFPPTGTQRFRTSRLTSCIGYDRLSLVMT